MTTWIDASEIDRLGERLKQDQLQDGDLRLLDEYRRSFHDVHSRVVRTIQKRLSLRPTGRQAKSTLTIAAKLRRQSVRLSRMYDIAGCRLVVSNRSEQDRVVRSLSDLFEGARIVDRRDMPSHGYRAVHVIVKDGGRRLEIQVRTSLQHLWAQVSEKAADACGHAIKYGGGNDLIRALLQTAATIVANQETSEMHGSLADESRKQVIVQHLDRISAFVRKWSSHDFFNRV